MKKKYLKVSNINELGVPFEKDLVNRLKKPGFLAEWNKPTGDIYLDTALGIIKARKEKQLSQKELAKITGTSQQAIARLENPMYRGRSLRILDKVAQALDKNLEIRFL